MQRWLLSNGFVSAKVKVFKSGMAKLLEEYLAKKCVVLILQKRLWSRPEG
jgi:hypothetical protein